MNNLLRIVRITIVSAFFLFLVLSVQLMAQADLIETNVPALKDVFFHDFHIGCLLSYPHVGFADDPPVPGQGAIVAPHGGDLIKFHMSSMSPGNNMKPQYTVNIGASAAAYTGATPGAERDSVDLHPILTFNGNLIAQLNWAQRQGFTFRGHTLVWHSQTPGTAFFRSGYTDTGTPLTKEQMTERMRNYIREVIRLVHESWPGLLSAFDVVNEAVNDNGTFRTSGNEWYTTFGDNSYIMKAFEFARAATAEFSEPQIKLYYNDYNSHVSSKADGIVALVGPIFAAGNIDGIGMQDHDAYNSPTAAQWIASYDKFSAVCNEIAVTELDVNPGGSLAPDILARQANQYAMLAKCFVERSARSGRGKLVSVSKDGLNDQLAFVANASLWDSQNKCKPAFYSFVNAGIRYNRLDSLITHADSLQSSQYTPASWSAFTTVLNDAKTARDQNYSYTVPADTTMGTAAESLTNALGALILVGVPSENGHSPITFELGQNYPNPFNPTTLIRYALPRSSSVRLTIYDILGIEIRTLVDATEAAGEHRVVWDSNDDGGKRVPSGVYFYRLESGQFTQIRKMMLLR